MVGAALAFVGGLALGSSLASGIATAVALALLVWTRGASVSAWATAVALAFFAAGGIRAPPPPLPAGWALAEGRVARVWPGAAGQVRVVLGGVRTSPWPGPTRFRRADDLTVAGRRGLAACARRGARVRVLVALSPAARPLSPWWRPRRGARALGPPSVCAAVSPPSGEAEAPESPLKAALARLPPSDGRAIVLALAAGDRSDISPPLREAFADAGFGHLLAISGLHLALIGGAAAAVARVGIRRWPRALEALGAARVGALAAASAAVAFAAAVGAPPSASRAAALVALASLASLARRAPDPASTLAAAAVLLLAFVPDWVHHIGFALSVSAVAALQVAAPAGRSAARFGAGWGRRLVSALRSAVAVSTVATLGTAPWLLSAFGRVSIVGLVSNVVAVPWATFVVLPLSLLSAGVAALSPDDALRVAPAAVATANLLAEFAVGTASVPGAAVTLGAHWAGPSAALVGALLLAKRSARAAGLVALVGVAWGLLATPGPSVTFLPVGHGDAALIRTGGSGFILVDTGTERAFDGAVTTALRRAGVRRLDLLVLSHGDADHAGGAARARERFAPRRVVGAGGTRMPSELRIRDARIERLGPSPALEREGSDNDRSLVLRLRLGTCAVLFPGDIEAAAERDLVLRVGEALATPVLKVPHHGSDTSSSRALLAAVRPDWAVVSVGPNPHGLPSRAALDRIRRTGIRVFRTDRDGLIELSCAAPLGSGWRTALD